MKTTELNGLTIKVLTYEDFDNGIDKFDNGLTMSIQDETGTEYFLKTNHELYSTDADQIETIEKAFGIEDESIQSIYFDTYSIC